MGFLKIFGFGTDKIVEQQKPQKKETVKPVKNPHDDGGCCGGCGSK